MRSLVFLVCLLACEAARAVIVQGNDGIDHTAAAGAGAGWDYVGTVGDASGVYLGNYAGSYWVLTAGHVVNGLEQAEFTLNGMSYSMVEGSKVIILNSSGAATDLTLFRIDGDPGLAALSISLSSPTHDVMMIGNGVNRADDETLWTTLQTNPDGTWKETGTYNPVTGKRGYKWAGASAKRWGANTVSGTSVIGNTSYFYTTFDRTAGDAQATVGDSGGGVFVLNGSTWELTGIMGLVGTFSDSGQPGSTAVYGNTTYSADLSVYRDQILDIVSASPVPEPGAGVCVIFGLAALGAMRLVRKGRAVLR